MVMCYVKYGTNLMGIGSFLNFFEMFIFLHIIVDMISGTCVYFISRLEESVCEGKK